VTGWMKPGVWPTVRIDDRAVFEEYLFAKGLEHRTRLGSATLHCVRAPRMVEEWLAFLEADPARWFPEPFVKWLARPCSERDGGWF